MELGYDMKSLLEFAKMHIEKFDEKYKMFLAKPEDVIGKKVVSIRSGFSNSGGGQVMLIDKIEPYGDHPDLHIHLVPCAESNLRQDERTNHLGWSCRYNERCSSIIFYKPEEEKE
jgi:hypothetical protein